MPETYVLRPTNRTASGLAVGSVASSVASSTAGGYSAMTFVGGVPPDSYSRSRADSRTGSLSPDGPWFLKEVDKNGGRAVQCFPTPEDCQRAAVRQPGPDTSSASAAFDESGSASASPVAASPSSALASSSAVPTAYVVQRHVANPLLLDDGRKAHVKVYR